MSDRKRKLDVFGGDASATQNGSALVSPLTGRLYSQRYHDILSKRKGEERSAPRVGELLHTTRQDVLIPFEGAAPHAAFQS